ncbi:MULTISPECIES: Rieske (2Fe-2S) protein [unclassified Streptomyces]|uniref:Rieske (2Fe-2S) protein n=1 Tax=unclassified Streptomyces TaxID=2593676 RepID=UPI0016603517|nr:MULTISPECIES: Rieske (2Fe-2S) protein [unclassified Streptomyces]MBD0707802.1 iron sulfur protein [Streptomyces sp. CBMA291]MBD0713017.1 iron sulfur protein [Streptomyces sp. CBMA370]
MTSRATTRRTVLFTAAALTTGCGSDDGGDGGMSTATPEITGTAPGTPRTPETPASPKSPEAGGTTPATPPVSPGERLASTSEIPVGGGKVITKAKVVVTQPKAGEFKAFSAICTHQGCTVDKVADGTIDCPCHGSKYRIADGTVAAGPAPRPLPPERITVSGDTITLA